MVKAATMEFEFVAEIAKLEAGLRQIKQGVNQTMREAVREHQKAEAAAERYAAALEKEAAAIGKTANEIKKMEIAANAAAAEQAGFVALAQRIRSAGTQLEATGSTVTRSTGAIRAGGMQLAQNLNDVAVQWQMQTPLMTIFAQQSGQVVQAIGLMTAETKGLLGFLGGPWGIALTSALVLASPFVMKLFEGSEGAKQQAEALKAQKRAIEDLDNATGRGNRTLEQRIRLGIEATKITLNEALALRTKLSAELASMQLTSEGRAGNYGGNYANDIKLQKGDLAARMAANDAAIKENEARIRAAARLTIMRQVTAETDKNAAATQRYDSALGRLNARYDAGGVANGEYYRQLKEITDQRDTELNADKAAAAAKRDHNKEVREAAKAARDLAAAQRELQGLLDTMQGKFDPEGAARAAYGKELAGIQKLLQSKLIDPDTAQQWAIEALRQLREAIGQVPAIQVADIKIDLTGFDDFAAKFRPIDLGFRSMQDDLDELDRAAQRLGDSLSAAFGHGGDAVAEMMKTLVTYRRQQQAIDESTDRDSIKRQRSSELQLDTVLGLTSAAKGLFSEHSRGYKAMLAAEKALTVVQLARTAIDVAGGAARMFATLGPLAFPAVGAMLAVMASLGFSGGGSAGSAPQLNEGKGTVFGDNDAKSDSLKRSIDVLADLDTEMLAFTRQMAASLKNIENSIGGLTNLVIRLGGQDGIGSSAAAGVKTGFNSALPGIYTSGAMSAAAVGMLLGGPIGAAIGVGLTKVPVIGDLIGFIPKLIGGLFGTKVSVVGQGIFGGAQSLADIEGLGFTAQSYADIKKKKKTFGVTTSTKYSTQFGELDNQLEDQFGKLLMSFADAIRLASGPLGLSLDEIDGKLASFVVDIGKIDLKGLSGSEIQEKLTAVFGAQADKMAEFAVAGLQQFQQVGEGYFETLVRVASTVETVTNSLQLLGLSTRSLGIDASMAIAGFFDDAAGYQQAAGEYFKAFYTQAEQAAAKTAMLGKVFDSLGIAMPDSIASYRALVEAQDLTTAAGQEMYATLLQLGPAFAEVISNGQQASSAAGILRERNDLERQLMEMQGDTVGVRAAELAQIDPSNRAMQERIWALQDEQEAERAAAQAAQEAATKQKAIADERMGLERQLLDLNGDTVALRALDIEKIDESNRALQLLIWARQDEAAAAQEAAAQAAARAAERDGLERQLLQLQGNTAELRRRELAALDPANRALQQQIYLLEDAADAASKAKQLADAWKSVGDSIMDEVKRIRGALGTEAMGYSGLLAKFNAATGAARGGDQDSAKLLPDLSRALLEAAASAATDALMLKRIQAVTAASLEKTYAIILGATGNATPVDAVAAFDPQSWMEHAANSTATPPPASDAAAEIRALRATVEQMRQDNNSGNAQIGGRLAKLNQTFDEASFEGEGAIAVRVVA